MIYDSAVKKDLSSQQLQKLARDNPVAFGDLMFEYGVCMKLKSNLAEYFHAFFRGRGRERERVFKLYISLKRRSRGRKRFEGRKSNARY